MLKKVSIILFIVFCFLCVSNICFATDNNMGDNVKNTINSGVNTVVDGVGNLAEDARNGVGRMENGIENFMNTDNTDNANNGNDNAGNYNATRTAITDSGNNGGMLGMDTTTMWIWVILAIAAIVIVGLVWYYGSQNNID